MKFDQLKNNPENFKTSINLAEADFLLISDPGFEGSSFLFNIASSLSKNVVWLAYEPPIMIENITSAYSFKGELRVISSKQWKSYKLVNIMNLNEVSIALSKAGEGIENFSLIFTIIPELLLIHGLEKTYLFLLNTIFKVHSQGGTIFALLTTGTQSKREELMIQRLFPLTVRLNKELTEKGWSRNLIMETPVDNLDLEVFPIQPKGYKIEIPEKLKENLSKQF